MAKIIEFPTDRTPPTGTQVGMAMAEEVYELCARYRETEDEAYGLAYRIINLILEDDVHDGPDK